MTDKEKLSQGAESNIGASKIDTDEKVPNKSGTEPPKKRAKRRKFSAEILGILAICFVISFVLFQFLLAAATIVVTNYCETNGIVVTDEILVNIDSLTLSISTVLSALVFTLLFLVLIGERLAYIRTLIQGIETIKEGKLGATVPLEGNNELTELGEAINFLSGAQLEVREHEAALAKEKEDFIRAISHDIRTPLTAILSYSQLMESGEGDAAEYSRLMKAKALQIKELSDILLDGSKRNLEHFEDADLLIKQLVAEFAEELEEDFELCIDADGAGRSAYLDTGEMRRIFDNLSSNVKKYAKPDSLVFLSVKIDEGGLHIEESNEKKATAEAAEGYRMGIGSIRRIAESYGGSVSISDEGNSFKISITLSEIQNL